MNLQATNLLFEGTKLVHGLSIAVPSSSTPRYVSMKNWRKCAVVLHILNGTTVTGSAITLKQASAIAGTGEKELAFSKAYRNIDCAAGDTLAEFAVSSNTFTTDTTNSKILEYVIDVDVASLDIANGFDCIRAGTGNAANTLGFSVQYILYGGRYLGAPPPTAITD